MRGRRDFVSQFYPTVVSFLHQYILFYIYRWLGVNSHVYFPGDMNRKCFMNFRENLTGPFTFLILFQTTEGLCKAFGFQIFTVSLTQDKSNDFPSRNEPINCISQRVSIKVQLLLRLDLDTFSASTSCGAPGLLWWKCFISLYQPAQIAIR